MPNAQAPTSIEHEEEKFAHAVCHAIGIPAGMMNLYRGSNGGIHSEAVAAQNRAMMQDSSTPFTRHACRLAELAYLAIYHPTHPDSPFVHSGIAKPDHGTFDPTATAKSEPSLDGSKARADADSARGQGGGADGSKARADADSARGQGGGADGSDARKATGNTDENKGVDKDDKDSNDTSDPSKHTNHLRQGGSKKLSLDKQDVSTNPVEDSDQAKKPAGKSQRYGTGQVREHVLKNAGKGCTGVVRVKS